MMDARRRLLDTWLPEALLQAQQTTGWSLRSGELSPASSDASFRRYFRWHDGQNSLIIMDAPPPQEDVRPFMRIRSEERRVGKECRYRWAAEHGSKNV